MFHESNPRLSIACKQASNSAFGSSRFLWASPYKNGANTYIVPFSFSSRGNADNHINLLPTVINLGPTVIKMAPAVINMEPSVIKIEPSVGRFVPSVWKKWSRNGLSESTAFCKSRRDLYKPRRDSYKSQRDLKDRAVLMKNT